MTLPTLQTARLRVMPLTLDDAPFILELVNDPDWIRFIGDKHVHSIADAEAYLRNGPLAMYTRYGPGTLQGRAPGRRSCRRHVRPDPA